jgi:hypothetical protein
VWAFPEVRTYIHTYIQTYIHGSRPVNGEGHIKAKQNKCVATTSTILIHYLWYIPLFRIGGGDKCCVRFTVRGGKRRTLLGDFEKSM